MALRDPAHPVDPRARTLWFLSYAFGGLVEIVVLCVIAYFWTGFAQRWWVVGALAAISVAYAVAVPALRYRMHRWEVSETAIYTQYGWWTRTREIAPMSRVQTVELSQGLLERMLGLASVRVHTASSSGDLSIDAIDQGTAQRLVDEFTGKAHLADGDAT